MITKTIDINLEKIRSQIEKLKDRLDSIDKVLNIQEKAINLLQENTKTLFKEATVSYNSTDPVEEIMKSVFTRGKLPKILYKDK